MDFLGPVDGKMYLIIIDAFSKRRGGGVQKTRNPKIIHKRALNVLNSRVLKAPYNKS